VGRSWSFPTPSHELQPKFVRQTLNVVGGRATLRPVPGELFSESLLFEQGTATNELGATSAFRDASANGSAMSTCAERRLVLIDPPRVSASS